MPTMGAGDEIIVTPAGAAPIRIRGATGITFQEGTTIDTRTGQIRGMESVSARPDEDREYLEEMKLEPTPAQRISGHVGRNDPCPCDSGKKFKRCCGFGSTAPGER